MSLDLGLAYYLYYVSLKVYNVTLKSIISSVEQILQYEFLLFCACNAQVLEPGLKQMLYRWDKQYYFLGACNTTFLGFEIKKKRICCILILV